MDILHRVGDRGDQPAASTGNKKSILGKLSGKARAPQPPGLVKRANSAGDADKKGKTIHRDASSHLVSCVNIVSN